MSEKISLPTDANKARGACELQDFMFLCVSVAEKNIVPDYLFYQLQAKHDSTIDVNV